MPPLRERQQDILPLASHFGQRFARRMQLPFQGLRHASQPAMLDYPWPGNVRELENVIERAVLLGRGQPLDCGSLLVNRTLAPDLPANQASGPVAAPLPPSASSLPAERDQWERSRILAALEQTRWRIRGSNGAAALLNLKPTTLEARIKRLGI